MKQDPVCLMEVKETEAVTAECDGVLYYFCSEGCRDKFLKDRTCARTAYDLIIIGGGPAGLTAHHLGVNRLYHQGTHHCYRHDPVAARGYR